MAAVEEEDLHYVVEENVVDRQWVKEVADHLRHVLTSARPALPLVIVLHFARLFAGLPVDLEAGLVARTSVSGVVRHPPVGLHPLGRHLRSGEAAPLRSDVVEGLAAAVRQNLVHQIAFS